MPLPLFSPYLGVPPHAPRLAAHVLLQPSPIPGLTSPCIPTRSGHYFLDKRTMLILATSRGLAFGHSSKYNTVFKKQTNGVYKALLAARGLVNRVSQDGSKVVVLKVLIAVRSIEEDVGKGFMGRVVREMVKEFSEREGVAVEFWEMGKQCEKVLERWGIRC